jgi:hypothetical protein
MGYLTTITIRNDALHTIEKNKDDFMEKLLRFCRSGGKEEYFSVGNHGNPVVLQCPRHADHHTVYMHTGNTVVEMHPYSERTIKMAEQNPAFFDDALKYLERQVKALKRLKVNRNPRLK